VTIEWPTYNLFAGRVGERFEATAGAESSVPLVLVEATQGTEPGGHGPKGQERLQFSLVFSGPPVLGQGTYRLTHAELGELDLFLVPIGRDGEVVRYEAAFA
jgi:hypothetical protein